MTVLTAETEGPFHCGPLALAANAYWWAGSRARLALAHGTPRAAAEQAQILFDIADAGHPAIRGAAAHRCVGLVKILDARHAQAHP